MAFFESHFFSETLGLNVSAHVLLPQRQQGIGQAGAGGESPGEGYPVLYLLHGLSDDHTIWMRRTSIERYAAARGLAVVMPAVGRSFYQDMPSGPRYWTFLSEELPVLLRGFFPLTRARAGTFAAGLSMGGYGALRLGLVQPERFAAVASLSGALDIVARARRGARPEGRVRPAEYRSVFAPAEELEQSSADLWAGAARLTPEERPALYLACGTEDELLGDAQAFHQHLEGLRFPHRYRERPGKHDWAFWDAEIQDVLAWLPLPAEA